MILTAHQPVYLPWLGLFHKIALADVFVSLDDVQFITNDWNNRNYIRAGDARVLLTVPVHTRGHLAKTLKSMEINNAVPWRRKHWQSILQNYRAAPHFARYADFLEDVYRQEWTLLTDLNHHLLTWLLDTLGLKPRWLLQSQLEVEGKKSDLVLNLCKSLGASPFIFGALGADYARVEDFDEAGIATLFQDYRHPEYSQSGTRFLSHLSVLDLLFHCGPSSLDVLMSGNVTRDEVLQQCRSK